MVAVDPCLSHKTAREKQADNFSSLLAPSSLTTFFKSSQLRTREQVVPIYLPHSETVTILRVLSSAPSSLNNCSASCLWDARVLFQCRKTLQAFGSTSE